MTMRPDPRRISPFARLALALILAAVTRHAAPAQSANANEAAIRAVIAQYALSVDRADVALASRIWSHDASVTFIHPLGTEHGFQQIADDVYVNLMGGLFSKRELILHHPVIHVYGDAAWSEMTWTFHATEKNGIAITTEGRETQVYHKERGGWRIVLVHYSGPPAKMPAPGSGY
jgi:ketosteroid isomerase-like protein